MKTTIGNLLAKLGIQKTTLTEEESGPDSFGVRQPWDSSEIASVLDPGSLATLVTGAVNGDAHDYLTLAEEMEERDLHYRSVLGTRKHAIESLGPIIEPAGDDQKSVDIADDITKNLIKKPAFNRLRKNALDALGKGYSVNEILWEISESSWMPVKYEWRDPRWFQYDRETGRKLQRRTDTGFKDLSPFKYIIHEPLLKSGLPIRGGLALPVAYYYLIKNYDLAGWAAFCEVYGYPIRLGKYDGRRGSKEDKAALRSAVRNLGRDVGAIIPKSMEIEIVNGVQSSGNVDLFERLADWVDKQISKGVLGQTMSTDAEGGQYKGDLHNEVRQEIRESDADELETTFNRDLIKPYVDLNHGVQEHYPTVRFPVPRPEDIPALIESIERLVPLGFKVGTNQLYRKLALARPDEKDEILQPVAAPVNINTEMNRQQPDPEPDALEEMNQDTVNDWMAISGPVRDALNSAIQDCDDFEELLKKLPDLVGNLNTENSAEKIAAATFKARALGDKEFEDI